jgi:flagellar basal body rod protein FlgB
MGSIYGTVGSGLDLAALQEAVSANNVANAQTPGFVPSQVDPTAQSGGGVSATVQPQEDPEIEANLDRNLMSLSQTNLINEEIAQQMALNSFLANLDALRADETQQQALVSIRA